jgi:hypothetical protein
MGPHTDKQKYCWSEMNRPDTPLQRELVILQLCQSEERNEILCDSDPSKFETITSFNIINFKRGRLYLICVHLALIRGFPYKATYFAA